VQARLYRLSGLDDWRRAGKARLYRGSAISNNDCDNFDDIFDIYTSFYFKNMRKGRSDLFKDKYRIATARLRSWDYRNSGYYFITICTKNMEHRFGSVEDNVMQLNELGQFASEYLARINEKKKNARLINHVVMPNHVHAIVHLKNKIADKNPNTFGPLLSGSLSALVNQYKSRVTKYANLNSLPWNGWHPLFHDHIIRNPQSFEKINNYITSNPQFWNTDCYFSPLSP
jgi:putative transposase